MNAHCPTYSFSLRSVHDGCKLQCRLYLPGGVGNIDTAQSWPVRGVILAHPYAPLGGTYDDAVISFLGGELLNQGYVVGTFNFRYSSCPDIVLKPLTRPSAAQHPLKDDLAGLDDQSWETM